MRSRHTRISGRGCRAEQSCVERRRSHNRFRKLTFYVEPSIATRTAERTLSACAIARRLLHHEAGRRSRIPEQQEGLSRPRRQLASRTPRNLKAGALPEPERPDPILWWLWSRDGATGQRGLQSPNGAQPPRFHRCESGPMNFSRGVPTPKVLALRRCPASRP